MTSLESQDGVFDLGLENIHNLAPPSSGHVAIAFMLLILSDFLIKFSNFYGFNNVVHSKGT